MGCVTASAVGWWLQSVSQHPVGIMCPRLSWENPTTLSVPDLAPPPTGTTSQNGQSSEKVLRPMSHEIQIKTTVSALTPARTRSVFQMTKPRLAGRARRWACRRSLPLWKSVCHTYLLTLNICLSRGPGIHSRGCSQEK